MSKPIKEDQFPIYLKKDDVLLAIVAKDKMFKIEPIGSNKNPGVTIDHYITRNMVLKHCPSNYHAYEISSYEFENTLKKLYDSYIHKIMNY